MQVEQGRPTTIRTLLAVEEELVNTLTHGVGLMFSLAGLYLMLVPALRHGTTWHIVGCTVYGCSLVLLYAASTLYHGVRNPRWKAILRIVDHVCIFLLIAGTYTPFTLTRLRGPWGWLLFVLVWSAAIAGITFKIRSPKRFHSVSALPYVVMGWLAVLAIKPCVELIPISGLIWLVVGGLCYTVGTIFYHADHNRYYHAIWHLFVLGGSGCHYWAVMSCVLA
jgi:hemolysin III